MLHHFRFLTVITLVDFLQQQHIQKPRLKAETYNKHDKVANRYTSDVLNK